MPKPPSAYVPLDINYLRDRDIRRAGPDAELLYIRALTYCKSTFSDGFIPEYDLQLVAVDLKAVQKRVDKLVEVGLWSRVDDGWMVRGWSLWNETSGETAAKKARAAERQARKRERDASESSTASHAAVTRDKAVTSRVSNSTKEEEEEEEVASLRDAERDVTPLRPRDELWDAIVTACGIEANMTKTQASLIGKVRRELAEVDATPNQVKVRANRWRQRYRDAPLTPPTLAKHWASLGDTEPPLADRIQDTLAALSKGNRP
jgi:hypothetical protein